MKNLENLMRCLETVEKNCLCSRDICHKARNELELILCREIQAEKESIRLLTIIKNIHAEFKKLEK